MAAGWRQRPDLSNPRARRTHDHMLAVARAMLHDAGPRALTFTAVGERAGVTRQTLYRHWPTREALLAEIITTGPHVGYPEPGTDARTVLVAFLTTLRDGLNDPPSIASLLAIAAEAGSDAGTAGALTRVSEDRRAALNVLLAPSGVVLTANDFARLVGPVIYTLLHARRPVTDALIADTADAWLAGQAATRESPL